MTPIVFPSSFKTGGAPPPGAGTPALPGSSPQGPAATGFAGLFPAIVTPVMPRQHDADPGKDLPATGSDDAAARPWAAPPEWPTIFPPQKPTAAGAAKGVAPQLVDPSADRAAIEDDASIGVTAKDSAATKASTADAESAPAETPLDGAIGGNTAVVTLVPIAPSVCPSPPTSHIEPVEPVFDKPAMGAIAPSVCPPAPEWHVEAGEPTGVPFVGTTPVMPIAPAAIGGGSADAHGHVVPRARSDARVATSPLAAIPASPSLIASGITANAATVATMSASAANAVASGLPLQNTRPTPRAQPVPIASPSPAVAQTVNGTVGVPPTAIALSDAAVVSEPAIAAERTSIPAKDGQTASTRPVAATVALPSADQLPTPSRVAPAAQMFAAAIQRAVRADRRPAEPALAAPLLGDAAPLALPAVAAAETSRHAALDMARANWPGAMIERIERLRDAADAADTSIRLVPDRLGAIDVSLRRDGDTVAVQFTAQAAETRQLLADAQPRLSEMAEAKGLRLSLHAGDGGSAAGQSQSQAQSQPQQQQRAAAPSINRARVPSPDAAAAAADRVA
ncbi:flagellar hook-length control protein FliK [Sphingomonas sp. TZW2008]|uniref:flagellar hook-length control protein FliK n=1 Tax=Sphingomonas sp. TZW2008 TaxID=1917973 RepID=UPI001181A6AE|nr:flagellar hook-length control protein FliK [Sphingomonas sp. TZW2008]